MSERFGVLSRHDAVNLLMLYRIKRKERSKIIQGGRRTDGDYWIMTVMLDCLRCVIAGEVHV